MLCPNCSKLALMHCNRSCPRCKGSITINIASLCETCSKQNGICAACLKRLNVDPDGNQIKMKRKGCNCGGKK